MEISSLSGGEMIQLYSSFVYGTTDALNCEKTLERSTPEATKIKHNCDHKYNRKVFELDGIRWNSCLCRFLSPSFYELMIVNKHYENGHMPELGSIMDQSNKIVEVMEIINHLNRLHKDEQHKQNERKANGTSRHRPPSQPGKRPTRA